MTRKLYFLIGLVIGGSLLTVMLYGLFFAKSPDMIPSALIGKNAEPFTITTFAGETLSLEDYRGRPVVLNFWASWCVSCRQEARIIEAAHQRYTPQGAAFIGVAINDTREASLAFIRKHGKTYTLAPDDKSGSISLNYGVTAVPETFLIDKNGIIQDKLLGAASMNTLVNFLDQQLQ